MGTVPWVLVRRTASPAHAGFGGLYSGVALVVVNLDVVSPLPSSSTRAVADCLLVGGSAGRDRGGMDSELQDGCPRIMTDVSQRWFSGHFRLVFFNAHALPRINMGFDVWGESGIMTGVY
jgi:hypothetical protein